MFIAILSPILSIHLFIHTSFPKNTALLSFIQRELRYNVLWVRKCSSDLGGLQVIFVPQILLPAAYILERQGPGNPFLGEKQTDNEEGQQMGSLVSLSLSYSIFLHLPAYHPLWYLSFSLNVVSLVRDIQKRFKEMGWFPDQQNGYDVIKIIDLGKKEGWVSQKEVG